MLPSFNQVYAPTFDLSYILKEYLVKQVDAYTRTPPPDVSTSSLSQRVPKNSKQMPHRPMHPHPRTPSSGKMEFYRH
jgi:hypothetical protein